MPLTRSFRETVADRARREPAFRFALLEEAIQALLDGEEEDARLLLRDIVNATVGFEHLAAATQLPVKSLMRMVGPEGNPTLANLVAIIKAVQAGMGARVKVSVEAVEHAEAHTFVFVGADGTR